MHRQSRKKRRTKVLEEDQRANKRTKVSQQKEVISSNGSLEQFSSATLAEMDARSSLNEGTFEKGRINNRWHGSTPITLKGEIEIVAKLNEGTHGEVFQGEWNGLIIAAKKFKAVSSTIDNEVYTAIFVNHPNIVTSYGIADEKGTTFLVMELMHRSLYDLLYKDNETLSPSIVIQIALDIAKGLNYLHSCSPKIIHRDLKAANILLDKKLRAKLSDFGTARPLNKDSLANTITGTLYFMAPEVLALESYDEKADIYSFGVVLYEMICRTCLPILEESKRITKIKEKVTDMELQQLIVACCQSDPAKRPNVGQCIDFLTQLVN